MSAVTALDWYRHHVDTRLVLPSSPVGPDLADGLDDFGQAAFDALDWDTAISVDVLLMHGDRGPLPARAVIELNAENRARADLAAWPNLSDTGYDR